MCQLICLGERSNVQGPQANEAERQKKMTTRRHKQKRRENSTSHFIEKAEEEGPEYIILDYYIGPIEATGLMGASERRRRRIELERTPW